MTTTASETRSAFDRKVRSGMFDPVRRFLYVDREDRFQEGLGLTWSWWSRRAEQGEAPDDALTVHRCRLRAMDLSRHPHTDGTQRKRDVLDPRNTLGGRLELLRLDDEQVDAIAPQTVLGFARAMSHNPQRSILSAINLEQWLKQLPDDDLALLELRATGHTLAETARALGVSTSSVFARSRRLGSELADHAQIRLGRVRRHETRARGGEAPR